MSVVRMRLRAEMRRRWFALFGLALLLGVAGGAVLAAAAGARRTNATIDDTLRQTLPADVLLNPDDLSAPGAVAEWNRIDQLPNIAAVATAGGIATAPVDAHGRADINAMIGDATLAALDDHMIRDVERDALIAGRYYDPNNPNEIVVSQEFVRKRRIGVDDHIRMRFFPSQALADFQAGRVPQGIDHNLTVTGVVLPLDDATRAADDPRLSPTMLFSPALARSLARAGVDPFYEGKFVRLRHGTADLPAFESAARASMPNAALNFQETAQTTERARRANRPYVVALWCFAALAAIATIAIVGQALSRSQRYQGQDLQTLRSLGVSEGSLLAHALLRGLIIGLAGALVAVALSIAASPIMPIGPLRPLAIDRGVHADWVVLLAGAAAIVVLAVVATLLGLREFRISRARRRVVPVSGDVPAPVFAGTRFALDPGRGPTAVPLRSTLLGITLALGALVASLVYGAGLAQFTSTPARYGWSWDYQVEFQDQGTAHAALTHDHDVAAIALGGYGQLGIGGRNVSAVGIEPVRGVPSLPILHGRAAHAPNEVVLGATTMRQLHVGLGDTVTVNVGSTNRRLRVVGTGVFPRFAPYPGSDPTGLGIGAVLTLDGLAAFDKADAEGAVGTGSGFYLVEMKPGVHTTATALHRKLFPHDVADDEVFGPQRPNDVLSYNRLQRTPLALAALLLLLGGGTAVHLLVTSVRRRRHELAVLKTVGYTRRQVAGTVMTQASILAALALIIGVPLGVVAGRWLWFVTANWLGIAQQVALPVAAIVAVGVGALVATNVIALVPGRAAARLHAAEVLRSE